MFNNKIIEAPNPANTWTAFDYKLNNKESVGYIKITNVSGKEIKKFRVSGKQGQQVWDTRLVKSGIYFYTLISNRFSKSGKIIIN